MTTIKFKKLRWSPHSKYGYAANRTHTIWFDTKSECDEWIKEYGTRTQYISLPYIIGTDLLSAEISEE